MRGAEGRARRIPTLSPWIAPHTTLSTRAGKKSRRAILDAVRTDSVTAESASAFASRGLRGPTAPSWTARAARLAAVRTVDAAPHTLAATSRLLQRRASASRRGADPRARKTRAPDTRRRAASTGSASLRVTVGAASVRRARLARGAKFRVKGAAPAKARALGVPRTTRAGLEGTTARGMAAAGVRTRPSMMRLPTTRAGAAT
mmetsp:Transcript_25385/g.83464  ORF Transcript_25385/g.83464 Transcript_25385/m.83464 type:complete len:203 (-) Transcript_25385:926-1534(-)